MLNIVNWDSVPVVFDVPMAARILGRTVDNVSRRCQRGELPAFRDGRYWRFEKNAFMEYIQQNSVSKLGKQKPPAICKADEGGIKNT